MEYDIVIIGGASAGLTAAIYSARQGLKTLVITKDIGGQALLTNEIQNYPGYDIVDGFGLLNKFKEEAETFGSEFLYSEAISLKKEEDKFIISTHSMEITALSVILAFGKTPRDLNVPGETEFKGHGVSYCAICDGPLFKNRDVAVYGNGDHAIQAVIYLASVVKKVYFTTKAKKIIGDDEMVNTLNSLKNVEIFKDSSLISISGDKSARSIKIRNNSSGDESDIEINAIFSEMGYIAKTDFVKNIVKLNESNEIIVDNYCKTSQEGIFACGDVTDIPYKQVVISAGQGATAALSAYNYVQNKKGKIASKSDWKLINTVNKK